MMRDGLRTMKRVILPLLLVAFVAGAYVFRDGIGLVVLLFLGIAVLVRAIRIAVGNASNKSLKDLWAAFKDAFWGIG